MNSPAPHALKLYATKAIADSQIMTATPLHLEEMKLLRACNKTVDLVVTTNYDNLMESIFPDYRVFSSQDALLVSETAGVAELQNTRKPVRAEFLGSYRG